MCKATKNDSGKPDLSLIPYCAVVELAKALMVGEKKYGRYNYTGGMELSRVVAALLRHAFSYYNGEEIDPADGQHHLGSVMACCAMILRQRELGTLVDDRYTPVVDPSTIFTDTAWTDEAIAELEADPVQFWRYIC